MCIRDSSYHHVLGLPTKPPQTCQIPNPLPFAVPSNLTILRRCTLQLNDSVSNARLTALAANYDILALRPVDEKTLQNACANLDADLISLDLTPRLGFFFKFKTLAEAVKRGVRLEIAYAQALVGDANARRNLIGNATQLIRAARGRGLVIGSEARRAVACRGPWDVVNLATIWGLAQDRGYEALSKEARSVVVSAKLKRTGYRGVVDVVFGGEKPAVVEKQDKGKAVQQNKKRKLQDDDPAAGAEEKPLSKREKKRRAKMARDAEMTTVKEDS